MSQRARSSPITHFFVCIIAIISHQAHSATSVLPPPSEVFLSLTLRDVAIDIYKQLISYQGNLVCSPLGISIPLAMLLTGAYGETASEIRKTLHYSGLGLKTIPARNAYSTELSKEKTRQNRNYDYDMANFMWYQSGINISTRYKKKVMKTFLAAVHEVDFSNKMTTHIMDDWAKKETGGSIIKLFGTDLNTETPLVLSNAASFNMTFESVDKVVSTAEPFTCVLPVPAVVYTRIVKTLNFEGRFLYGKSFYMKGDYQLVEIPYKNERFGLILVVPNTVDGLKNLEENLSYHLDSDIHNMEMKDEVVVSIPQFTVASVWKLNEPIKSLGVKKAFDKVEAKLFGMGNNNDNIFVGDVIQSATVLVDHDADIHQKNTIHDLQNRKTTNVIARHPFMFIIRDKENGFILFIGRVVCL